MPALILQVTTVYTLVPSLTEVELIQKKKKVSSDLINTHTQL